MREYICSQVGVSMFANCIDNVQARTRSTVINNNSCSMLFIRRFSLLVIGVTLPLLLSAGLSVADDYIVIWPCNEVSCDTILIDSSGIGRVVVEVSGADISTLYLMALAVPFLTDGEYHFLGAECLSGNSVSTFSTFPVNDRVDIAAVELSCDLTVQESGGSVLVAFQFALDSPCPEGGRSGVVYSSAWFTPDAGIGVGLCMGDNGVALTSTAVGVATYHQQCEEVGSDTFTFGSIKKAFR